MKIAYKSTAIAVFSRGSGTRDIILKAEKHAFYGCFVCVPSLGSDAPTVFFRACVGEMEK